jgi:hypothetical protein
MCIRFWSYPANEVFQRRPTEEVKEVFSWLIDDYFKCD